MTWICITTLECETISSLCLYIGIFKLYNPRLNITLLWKQLQILILTYNWKALLENWYLYLLCVDWHLKKSHLVFFFFQYVFDNYILMIHLCPKESHETFSLHYVNLIGKHQYCKIVPHHFVIKKKQLSWPDCF